MKKVIVALVIILIGGYLFFGSSKEVNDVAAQSPYESPLIQAKQTTPMPKGYLASGISYDWDSSEYIMLSDHPHKLFAEKVSTLMAVDESMENIVFTTGIPSDSDLEGVAYLGNNRLNAISESGMIYVIGKDKEQWTLQETKLGLSGTAKKVSSLAYDTDNDHLYTAEKEGTKTLYKMDSDGNLLETINLELPKGEHSASIHDNFTISGLAYERKKLLILSEAYSTIFVYDLTKREIVRSIGLDKTHETSGITINKDKVVTLGDFEDYLPDPVFSQFDKSKIF